MKQPEKSIAPQDIRRKQDAADAEKIKIAKVESLTKAAGSIKREYPDCPNCTSELDTGAMLDY